MPIVHVKNIQNVLFGSVFFVYHFGVENVFFTEQKKNVFLGFNWAL